MEQACIHCNEISSSYDTIGKTYYKLPQCKDEPVRLLCYRHWYQAGQPDFVKKGDYIDMFSKNTYIKRYEKRKTF